MACADLAVGKPGGLSTSECLALGLPMLVVSPIPGQEERKDEAQARLPPRPEVDQIIYESEKSHTQNGPCLEYGER